ncbi:MAG: hypothetical protein ACRBCJ_02580 [Hyphomicrobiaceae bacterium]
MLKCRLKSAAISSAIALTAATIAVQAGNQSPEVQAQTVETHPSRGDVQTVNGAAAHIAKTDNGLFASLDTEGLKPGNVYTLWLVVINDPDKCSQSPCSSKDVLKRSKVVSSDVGYAGGIIAAKDGSGHFAAYQSTGKLSGAWFNNGLKSPTNAEVHLVVNDHGPLIANRTADMLSTYRGGCTDVSIPKPMPGTARADGTPGPNTCRLWQHAIFKK